MKNGRFPKTRKSFLPQRRLPGKKEKRKRIKQIQWRQPKLELPLVFLFYFVLFWFRLYLFLWISHLKFKAYEGISFFTHGKAKKRKNIIQIRRWLNELVQWDKNSCVAHVSVMNERAIEQLSGSNAATHPKTLLSPERQMPYENAVSGKKRLRRDNVGNTS